MLGAEDKGGVLVVVGGVRKEPRGPQKHNTTEEGGREMRMQVQISVTLTQALTQGS